MKRFIVFLMVVGAVSSAYGIPILEIIPAEILVGPGDSAQFEVRLVDATHFAGFYFELDIAPQPEATGTVEVLGAFGDEEPRYCFSGFNDLFQVVVYGGNKLVVGDQTNPPDIEVNTSAGVNDLLAIVEINASPDAWGVFDVAFDDTSLELFDQFGNDIPDFDQTAINGATIIVPEPVAIVFLTLVAGIFVRRRHRVQS